MNHAVLRGAALFGAAALLLTGPAGAATKTTKKATKTTKAAVRKAGKNVIILVMNNKDVCDDKGFARTVFAGVVHADGKKDEKLVKVKMDGLNRLLE